MELSPYIYNLTRMLLINQARLCFTLRHSLFLHSVYQFLACARQIWQTAAFSIHW